MAIGSRFYTLPSKRNQGRRSAGVTRETSWAWSDIYEGGGTLS